MKHDPVTVFAAPKKGEKLNLVKLFRAVSEIKLSAEKIKGINKRMSESTEIDFLCDCIIDKINSNGAE